MPERPSSRRLPLKQTAEDGFWRKQASCQKCGAPRDFWIENGSEKAELFISSHSYRTVCSYEFKISQRLMTSSSPQTTA